MVQVVGQASRLSVGRLALGANNAGETPGAAGGTPAPLPEQYRLRALVLPETEGSLTYVTQMRRHSERVADEPNQVPKAFIERGDEPKRHEQEHESLIGKSIEALA